MAALDSLIGQGLVKSPYQSAMEDRDHLLACLERMMNALAIGTSANAMWEMAYDCLQEVGSP